MSKKKKAPTLVSTDYGIMTWERFVIIEDARRAAIRAGMGLPPMKKEKANATQ